MSNSVLNKGKSVTSALFNGTKVLFSASNKAKMFAENIFKNCNHDQLPLHLLSLPEPF